MKLFATLCLFVGIGSSEGICVPEAIKSSVAEGTIFFVSEQRPLSDVRIEIAKYAHGTPVAASGTTGNDGKFSISGIKPGRYWLNARHPVVGHFEVEFRVPSFWPRKRRILIVIGGDPSKGACWGGYAKTYPIQQ